MSPPTEKAAVVAEPAATTTSIGSSESVQPIIPPPVPPVVPVVHGYEILGELGRGGMGVVYKARQVAADRVVALKMVLGGCFIGDEERARFRTEAEAIARLSHTHIIQVHEVGEAGGVPFFSLEFCDGGSLDRKLAGTPLPPREAAALVENLARATQAAHQKGVIHRDLKPSNVLLSGDGTPKITDFGLARKLDDAGRTATGAVMGTPAYMAPEQAAGRSKDVGPAADIYALGAILYECLVGRPPFKSASTLETLAQVLHDEPVSPAQLQRGIPRDLETICLKCLAKEPEKRYATAADLADDLGRFLRGEPIAARPLGGLGRAWRWTRRHPAAASLLTLTAASLIAGTVVSLIFAFEADRRAVAEGNARRDEETQHRLAVEQTALVEKQKKEAERLGTEAANAAKRAVDAGNVAERRRQETDEQLGRVQHAFLTMQLMRVNALLDRDPELGRQLLTDPEACPRRLRDFTWGLHYHWSQAEAMATLQLAAKPISALAYRPDGTLAVAQGGRVKLWNPGSGEVKDTGPEPKVALQVQRLLVTPEGKLLAAGVHPDRPYAPGFPECNVAAWNVATLEAVGLAMGRPDKSPFVPEFDPLKPLDPIKMPVDPLRPFPVPKPLPKNVFFGKANCVAFSADGKRFAAGDSGALWVWDTGNGKLLLSVPSFPRTVVEAVALSADGKMVASADSTVHTVVVHTVPDGTEKYRLQGHSFLGVTAIAFSRDGKALASADRSGNVRLWDLTTGKEVATMQGHSFGATCICFSADGSLVATGGKPEQVKVWDAVTGQERFARNGHAEADVGGIVKREKRVDSVAFSPDGKVLASGGADGSVKLWNLRPPSRCRSLTRSIATSSPVAFSPDGKTVAAATSVLDPMQFWDVATGTPRQEPRIFAGYTDVLVYSPDGKTLALDGGVEHSLILNDAATGKILRVFGPANTAAYSPDGGTIATGGADGLVRLWDPATGKQRAILRGHPKNVDNVTFSPDGKELASGAADGIRLWDVAAGKERLRLEGRGGLARGLCYSPDGKTLAAGFDWDWAGGSLRLWNAKTGAERLTWQTGNPIRCLAFSRDGRTLVSGGGRGSSIGRGQGTLQFWDPVTGKDRLTLFVHDSLVTGLAFSPDGTTLATCGQDRTVKLWRTEFPARRWYEP